MICRYCGKELIRKRAEPFYKERWYARQESGALWMWCVRNEEGMNRLHRPERPTKVVFR